MASTSPRRGSRKNRHSIARLSSDTTASLPVYSQNPYARSLPTLPGVDPIDPPPQYQYEADADEESDGGDGDSELDRVPPLSPQHSLRRHAIRPNTPGFRGRRSHFQQHRHRSSLGTPPFSPSPSRVRSVSTSPSRPSSPNDPYLDALLARSVQALEVSNALLQSSMSTQTSLAALIANDSPPPSAGLSNVIPNPRPERQTPSVVVEQKKHDWTVGMNDLQKEVTALFDPSQSSEVSRSLPCDPGPSPIRQRLRTHARIRSSSSTDLRTSVIVEDAVSPATTLGPDPVGELHFGVNPRSHLISPAPRALTQYIDCDPFEVPNEEEVLLPSTLGLRATGQAYHVPPTMTPSPTHSATPQIDGLPTPSSSRTYFMSSFRPGRPVPAPPPQSPPEPKKQSEPGFTPSAVSILSSFLPRRHSGSTDGSKPAKPAGLRVPRRRASIETTSPTTTRPISYHYQHEQTQLPHRANTPTTPSSSTTVFRSSRSPTPTRQKAGPPPPLNIATTRKMTPPLEVSSPSPDSDSPTQPRLALSVQALRKILTDQPPPPPKGLQPRTAVAPTVGTSHATASISRLFTRGTHMHAGSEDARVARRSALKQRNPNVSQSAPITPDSPVPPSAQTMSFLGLPLPGLRPGSASSSGRSTPKRISFAALPDDTTGTVRGNKRTRSRSRSKSRDGSRRRRVSDGGMLGDDGAEGWWATWLMGGSGGFVGMGPGELPATSGSREPRRSPTAWGRGFHGMEDFAV